MDPQALEITGWFTLGMTLSVVPKLKSLKEVYLFILVMVGTFFFSLLPGRDELVYNLQSHLKYFFVFAMGATFLALRDSIIPRVNEHLVACNTVILSYALAHLVPIDLAIPMAIGAILPTAAVFYSIIQRNELDPVVQIFLYFWNDVIFLILIGVQYNAFTKLLPSFEAVNVPEIQIVLAGMMFATVALPVMGLLYLIPIPAKHQPMEERIAQIRAYLAQVVHNFTEENTSPARVLFVAIIVWSALTINRIYPTFSDFNIISILILGVPLVIKPAKPVVRPAQVPATKTGDVTTQNISPP